MSLIVALSSPLFKLFYQVERIKWLKSFQNWKFFHQNPLEVTKSSLNFYLKSLGYLIKGRENSWAILCIDFISGDFIFPSGSYFTLDYFTNSLLNSRFLKKYSEISSAICFLFNLTSKQANFHPVSLSPKLHHLEARRKNILNIWLWFHNWLPACR